MVILHIAKIYNVKWSGVRNVVPMHVNEQGKYEDVALANICHERISECNNQLEWENDFSINKMPIPFNKPDIVLFHEVYHIEYIKIYKELMKQKIPYLIVPHSSLTKQAKKRKQIKKRIADILWFNQFVRCASAVQCLSKKEFDESNITTPKIISTNGIVEKKTFKEYDNNTKKRIVYIGRLEYFQKGLDILVCAAEKIRKEIKANGAEIHIFGPDNFDEGKKVRALVKQAGVEDIIKVHDEAYGEQKVNELLKSDAFIQSSRFEGMPMGVLEALSYGIPCIITEGTNLTDIVQKYDAGWISENDIESLARGIMSFLQTDEKQLQEKSANAKRLIEREYNWATIAKDAVEQYRGIVDKK